MNNPTDRMRIVTQKLTPRQLRALTAMSQHNVTVPDLCRRGNVIPPSAYGDLQDALGVVFSACKVVLDRYEMKVPSMFGMFGN